LNKNGEKTNIDDSILELTQENTFHSEFWYSKLPKKLTFESWLIPLTNEEADMNGDFDKIMPILIEKVDKIMKENEQMEYFVKLNSVSPKDTDYLPNLSNSKDIIMKLYRS